jgi:hypothetical protein
MSLQYAVWAMAAIGHPKYDQYSQVFYQRARQYIEADEMKVRREALVFFFFWLSRYMAIN